MNYRLKDIAKKLEGKLSGNGDILIKGYCSISEAKRNHISFYSGYFPEKYLKDKKNMDVALLTTRAIEGYHCVVVDEMTHVEKRKTLSKMLEIKECFSKGIHPTAVIGSHVLIGKNVSVGAHSVIGDYTRVGEDTVIYPQVVIYPKVKIGKKCIIHSGTVIRGGTEIGHEVEIDANVSIATTAFERGFDRKELKENPILTTGVKICNGVFIGANSIIHKGTSLETVIGEGSKIDAMVYIAYGVKSGKFCRIAGQSAISAKCIMEDDVSIGGQVGVYENMYIGKKAFLASGSKVIKNVKRHGHVSGTPSMETKKWIKIQAIIRNLPEMWEKLKKMRTSEPEAGS